MAINENANVSVHVNGKSASRSLSALQKSASQYKKELEQANRAGDLKGYKKAKRNLNQVNKEMKQLKRQTFSVDKVTQNLSTASYNDLRKASRKLNRELNEMNRESEEYLRKQKQLKSVNTQMSKHRQSIRATRKSTSRLSGVFSDLLPMLSLGTLAMGIQRLLKMQDELAKTKRDIKNLTEATGDEFANITAQVRALSNNFNTDYKKVLVAANSVAKQFEITQQKALDKIEKGFINGANASGEFLQQLKEYPAQFALAKFEADDLFSVITQSVKSGIYSDKGADAIKEATISIREMNTTTREAMEGIGLSADKIQKQLKEGSMSLADVIRMVSERINELPAESEKVGKAIADIFRGAGENAGYEFLTTLKDIDGEFDDVIDQSNEYAKQQREMVESSKALEKAWNSLFGGTKSWWKEIKIQFNSFLADYFSFVDDVIKRFGGDTSFFGNLNKDIKKQDEAHKEFQETLKEDKEQIDKNADAFISSMKQEIKYQEKKLETGTANLRQLEMEREIYGEAKSKAKKLSETERQEIKDNLEMYQRRLEHGKKYIEQLEKQEEKENDTGGGDKTTTRTVDFVLSWDSEKIKKQAQELSDEINNFITQANKVEEEDKNPLGLNLDVEDEEIQKVATNAQYVQEQWEQTYQGRKAALDQALADMEISEKEHADRIAAIEREKRQMQMQAASEAAGNMAEVFGENTVAYKAIASTEAIINTYLAASKALTRGPIIGPILAATITAQGLAQVAKINNVDVPQAATGRYDVIGGEDGKSYSASYEEKPSTGVYSEPTLFAETGKELIVDPATTKNIQMNYPGIMEAINEARVPQRAAGAYGQAQAQAASQPQPQPQPPGVDERTRQTMERFNATMDSVVRNGVRGKWVLRDLEEKNNEVQNSRNQVRR